MDSFPKEKVDLNSCETTLMNANLLIKKTTISRYAV